MTFPIGQFEKIWNPQGSYKCEGHISKEIKITEELVHKGNKTNYEYLNLKWRDILKYRIKIPGNDFFYMISNLQERISYLR